MFNPQSTYRIQFNKDFNFNSFEKIIPYLQKLGIKTIYASPIFKAVPGSTHGYDITCPLLINPEIGTIEQLYNISTQLKTAGISWLQDIVPNHMAYHPDNEWLMDVLEKGKSSKYAECFDIDWQHHIYKDKVILPILGKTLDDTLNAGELSIIEKNGKHHLNYFDNLFPVNTNANSSDLQDKATLKNIIDQQHYIPALWSETNKQLNYRRFFTINGLISFNIQNRKAFNLYHILIKRLCSDKIFQGLRVDHIDGLADPTEYLYDLRQTVGDDIYITIEKILEPGEQLPPYWPISGSTGYDFLALANNVLSNSEGLRKLHEFYADNIADRKTYAQILEVKKSQILYNYMQGDLDNLYRLFLDLHLTTEEELTQEMSDNLKKVIALFLVKCPVYKYYGNKLPLDKTEADAISDILNAIILQEPPLGPAVQLLKAALLEKPSDGAEEYNNRAIQFYLRCMQFTCPLMAKGGEDTAMYTYNSFIGHNEVGDAPQSIGVGISAFHETVLNRQQIWPMNMNATATHDTKRGEDVRARLNAITDISAEWTQAVSEWQEINKDFRKDNAPDKNDEYFIYQSLIGCYPMPSQASDDFHDRFQSYILKAFREAKVHTTWELPNEDYENNVKAFINNLLAPNGAFLRNFKIFYSRVADAGIINSLIQLILKFTCPGVPDVYQGSELWDLSMVDPDNRRLVDYPFRTDLLASLPNADEHIFNSLWDNRYTGKIKLWLTTQLLAERAEQKYLFEHGRYIPLETVGAYKDHILAYARVHRGNYYIVVLPLNILSIATEQGTSFLAIDWKDTSVILPNAIATEWQYLFTAKTEKSSGTLPVKELFSSFPIAILKNHTATNRRSAGVLLPVFSLPSHYGIGDFGPGTESFIDLLARSGQKYWQLLPLSPTERQSGHSPYSSFSGMGVNVLFISPEYLVKEHLLSAEKLNTYRLPQTRHIDYKSVEKIKRAICIEAYGNFCKGNFTALNYEFKDFCRKTAYWLNDVALFVTLKRHFKSQPWYKWPEEYKKRNTDAIARFSNHHQDNLMRVKWLQFIISRQWKHIRHYANTKGIRIFGDLPFYVSYDSADVWANPEMFCLDDDGRMTGVAGVPPDYFSKTGQLWNMPTYNWGILRKDNYKWWMDRIRKNLELFDIVRLDHFRAFHTYWQVPANEVTAQNGQWIEGPGKDFFDKVRNEFGELPFVAEDLGENMDAVYSFREQLGLPGMKLLQFAWGNNMPVSVDAPHNYPPNCVVYTGTHDNNTTKGWFKNEMQPADKKRLAEYCGITPTKANIDNILTRIAYASVAETAILPLQDLLGYDKQARINTPGSSKNNWLWRLPQNTLSQKLEQKLLQHAAIYNRLLLF